MSYVWLPFTFWFDGIVKRLHVKVSMVFVMEISHYPDGNYRLCSQIDLWRGDWIRPPYVIVKWHQIYVHFIKVMNNSCISFIDGIQFQMSIKCLFLQSHSVKLCIWCLMKIQNFGMRWVYIKHLKHNQSHLLK